MATRANTTHGMPVAGVSSASPPHPHQHTTNEDWPIESQKVKDEQIQAFYREYAKRIATALTQHTSLGKLGGNAALLEETLQDPIIKPSQEELMELYTSLLRDNQDLHPKIKQVLTDQSFVVSSFTSSLAERLEKQLAHPRPPPASPQRAPCGCAIGHGDHGSLDFPDDSYEDEPDEESFDDEDEDDDDEDDADYDDEDDEDDDDDDDDDDDSPGDDEDDDEYDETYEDGIDDGIDDGVIDGYSNHYQDSEVSIALEEERRKFAAILKRRDEGKRRLEEEFRRKSLLNIQKRNLEAERIQLLQRLRLEDEERRKKEQQEKERKEKLDQETQRKREAAEADQSARSFLFESTANGHAEVVKKMVEATPADSQSIAGVPRFFSATATRLTGWEFVTLAEDEEEVNEKRGIQETLLHVAARAGSLELVDYLISRGALLDSLDSEGRTPLHTAAENSAPLDVLRLLLERGAHYMDRNSVAAGKTALHYAAQTGNGPLVAMLLQHHARVSTVDIHGNTPEMLAKAGLDREKGSKAKSKLYREALQHIQKALAAIKEAQKQRDAALEEQRKREEELAREEAEKDRAARRKQEEKLEADKRRREEEEKELARLKALASDPHGQSSGGGAGKKKKKKKGKGGSEAQSSGKDSTMPNKTLAAPALQNAHTRSNASTPMGSPAISHASAVIPPSLAPPQSGAAATSGHPSPKTALSKAAPSTAPISGSSGTSHNAAFRPVLKPTVKAPNPAPAPLAPTRLPKAKTSYRPSQLVVIRMADMGFPERESRKALIQTEGKFEEAIELLTSGAPLADDSEDEAEQKAAKEAARLKARASEVSSRSSAMSTGKRQGEPANTFSQETLNGSAPPSPGPSSTATSKTGPGLQQQQQPEMLSVLSGSAKTPAPASKAASGSGVKQIAPPKGTVGHPVQILQRTPAMAPHVQMRSVPTQVLQRPSHHPQPHALKSPSNVISVVPTPTATATISSPLTAPAITKRDTTPFLAQRVNPPLPPTRAPYSYGSSQRPLDAGHGNSYTVHPGVHVRPGARPALQPRSASAPAPAPTPTPAMAALETALSATRESTLDYDSHAGIMWDTLGVNQMSSTLNLPQTSINPTSNVATTAQDNLWGSASLLHPQANMGKGMSSEHDASSPFQSSLLIGTASPSTPGNGRYHSALSPPSALNAASMNDMLRQSQMDMMDNGDAEDGGDMLKDVLAMTGAIDAEDLAESFSEYSLLGAPSSSQSDPRRATAAAAPVASAVGQGRTSAAVTSNPVASLWGYGAFTHDIGPLLNQSLSTTTTKLSFEDYQGKSMRTLEDVFEYNQWNNENGFGAHGSRRESQHQGPIAYNPMQESHLKTTLTDDLVGSSSPVYDPSLESRRRSSAAAAEANLGMFGERGHDAEYMDPNRQRNGSSSVVRNDNSHHSQQSQLTWQQQQQQRQYPLHGSLLSPSSPTGSRSYNNTHSPSTSCSVDHGPSPSSVSMSSGYGFGSPMGSVGTMGNRWGNQPPGLTSPSVPTSTGTGPFPPGSGMQLQSDTDQFSPSRGVQALNEALAFSRYPKLDRPDKSSPTTNTTTTATTTPPSTTFSAPVIDSPQRQRRDPWGM